MNFKFNFCMRCRYKNRRKDMFPCSECKGGCYPSTCEECRLYPCTKKKGIRTCDKFEWD